jgi:hypothetical protein
MRVLNKYVAGDISVYILSNSTSEKPNPGSLKAMPWEWVGFANLKQNVAKAIEGLSFSKEEKEKDSVEEGQTPAGEPKQEEPKKASLAEAVRILASVLPSETE